MRSKSATGTEYVNAQVEELKEIIDEYAEKIADMSSGAMLGLIWYHVFQGPGGAVVAYITGDGYKHYYDSEAGEWKDGYMYTLHGSVGFNGDGGWSDSVDSGIIDVTKPEKTVEAPFTPSWYDYSPDVRCFLRIDKKGRVSVDIGQGPSGQANTSASWYRSGNYAE